MRSKRTSDATVIDFTVSRRLCTNGCLISSAVLRPTENQARSSLPTVGRRPRRRTRFAPASDQDRREADDEPCTASATYSLDSIEAQKASEPPAESHDVPDPFHRSRYPGTRPTSPKALA